MGITVRPAASDADYEAWRRVRQAVVPGERAPTAGELRRQAGPLQRYVLAELGGMLAGSGAAGKSDLTGAAAVAARVLPSLRRRGVGSAILRVLGSHAAEMGFMVADGSAGDPGSVRFAERFGFREIDREVEQVKLIGGEPPPVPPEGVTIVPVSARPGLWREAYETIGRQAFADMATVSVLEVSLEQWERDWIGDPGAMFLALAGGEIIGCAGLIPDPGNPGRAEHALTVVRRDWRRRGVAAALKRTTLAWAAGAGLTEVRTWTQRGNEGMRALNTSLGYTTVSESIRMRASLPLPT